MNNAIRKAQEELNERAGTLDKASREHDVARREYEWSAQKLTDLLLRAGGAVIAIAELAEPAAEAVA